MTQVALRRCMSYDPREVRGAVEAALLSAAGGSAACGTADLAGKRVLLKPNLAAARRPERGVTTHPEVVGAAIDFFRDRGCAVAVGDSPSGAVRGVKRVWENTGMEAICRSRGATLVNFEASGWNEREISGKTYRIVRALGDFDLVVSIPKFKTHVLTMITGAVKNLYGCVPGFGKSALHLANPRPAPMSKVLVDVFSIAKPWLNLVDAVEAMEGNGPSSGEVRCVGLIAASSDAVALDAVLARIVGLDPLAVPTTREAARRGLGTARMEEIAIDGDPLETFAAGDFKIPSNWYLGLIPDRLAHLLLRWFWVKPRVLEERCTRCGDCARICAASAIEIGERGALLNREKCVSCLCCIEACPAGALEPQHSRLARFVS